MNSGRDEGDLAADDSEENRHGQTQEIEQKDGERLPSSER
jgi:hypothetical protein